MRHLSEGMLRRVHDDKFATSNDERAHLAGCNRCRQRMDRVAGDATLAAQLFAIESGGRSAVEPALARFQGHLASDAPAATGELHVPRRIRSRRWAIGLLAAPVVAVALVVSANAAGWLSIFSPTTVAPVTLTVGDITGLPDLSAYGHMHLTQPDSHQVSDAAAASAATGLAVLRPAALPADVPAQVQWQVIGTGSATLTLDTSAGTLSGASITVNAGPGAVAVYGGGAGSGVGLGPNLPALVIGEGMRPTASTNGATLAQLETFLLSRPSVSPQLAAEIRAIGQPASTLPIPIIAGVMTSQTITVDGVQGVVTGDSSGLGTAVIWEKDGIVHVVAGTISQNEVVGIARSLH